MARQGLSPKQENARRFKSYHRRIKKVASEVNALISEAAELGDRKYAPGNTMKKLGCAYLDLLELLGYAENNLR